MPGLRNVAAWEAEQGMTWNYRVIDHGEHFSVREVYYDGERITHWTAKPRELSGETIDDIEADLRLILAELRKRPPIPEADLPLERPQ